MRKRELTQHNKIQRQPKHSTKQTETNETNLFSGMVTLAAAAVEWGGVGWGGVEWDGARETRTEK